MAGSLYLVATPIGNLEDVSARALRTLREVALVLAEDTRVTKKLLSHFDIHTPLESFHEYTDRPKIENVLDRLGAGESIALVTDAGTPGVSDPGAYLVSEAVRRFGDELKTFSIPGPSAVTAALSVSGFPSDVFTFLGFLPVKKGRTKAVADAAARKETLVLFESPHRIVKTLAELAAAAPERHAIVIREISKLFETTHRGTLAELALPEKVRAQGEFVIVLGPIK
jgi:16S rRNA (cytidine1402-2'-O)-methyltransferase